MSEDLSSYNLPDDQIEQMVRMGFNREEFFAKRALYRQQRDLARQQMPQPQVLKLSPYNQIPRGTDTPFFKDTAGSAPWLFGKQKWLTTYANAPIVFCAVVQANDSLRDPGNGEGVPIVVTFSTAPQFMQNVAWVRQLADTLGRVRDSGQAPPDCQALVASLRDPQSIFCWKVGPGLTGGVEAWCATTKLAKQTDLPNGCLPFDGVLPFLLLNPPRDNYSPALRLIPKQYYA